MNKNHNNYLPLVLINAITCSLWLLARKEVALNVMYLAKKNIFVVVSGQNPPSDIVSTFLKFPHYDLQP